MIPATLLISYLILWIFVIVESAAIFALYHHFARMYLTSREGRQSQGPAIGSQLKALDLMALAQTRVKVPSASGPTLLVFMSTTCQVCSKLRLDIIRFVEGRDDFETVVICAGDTDDVRKWSGDLGSQLQVVPDPGYQIAANHGIGITPFLVATDRYGIVRAKGLVNGRRGLEWAADEVLSADHHPRHPISVVAGEGRT